jgi:two-component system, chemotaxis family, protein-glutamate methylesterase/glutaminase
MPQPIRLLVVDDSALMRKHMRQIFEAEGGFTLAFARNGREALEQAASFQPDVVTLDVNMPELDGISCLEQLMLSESPARVVMVSSLTEEGAAVTLRALELGAVDFVPKPDGTVSLSIDRIRPLLLGKVRAAALARPRRVVGLRARVSARRRELDSRSLARPAAAVAVPGVVLIGVSTGGPRTLEEILPALPADYPFPVLVAQHMPASFTGVFARRMDSVCQLEVREVDAPMPLAAGCVYIGRGDADIVVERRLGRPVANTVPADDTLWHPSADRLVASAMQVVPPAQLTGVLLTGMGHDGASTMAELRARGGRTIAESQDSAVVFGMPAELIRRGGADLVLPAERVAAQLQAWARRGR